MSILPMPEISLAQKFIVELTKASFTAAEWQTPESNLDTEAFCSVCLIDENDSTPKLKGKCHLPIRSRPGAPINKNALRNAAARLSQTKASSESLAKAKRRLITLMTEAGIATTLEKAYPNEHTARQHEPNTYERFARKELAPGVYAIIGFPSGGGGSEIQSVRFSRDKFTPEEAKKWLNEHKLSAENFEASSGSGNIEKMGPTVGMVHIPTIEQDNDEHEHHSDCQCDICQTKRHTEHLNSEPIAKATFFSAAPERRLAYAIAYPVYPAHSYDSQGDRAQPDEIEKMAHDFMINSQKFDFQHLTDVPRDAAYVVESYLAPVDFTLEPGNGLSKEIRKGSWVVVTYFADESLWQLVKSGKINAYSIFGKGKRIKVE